MAAEGITQFCVCSEEMCYCANMVEMKLDDAAKGREWECSECAEGHHVREPGGARS